MLNSSTLSPSEFDDIPSYEDFSHGCEYLWFRVFYNFYKSLYSIYMYYQIQINIVNDTTGLSKSAINKKDNVSMR